MLLTGFVTFFRNNFKDFSRTLNDFSRTPNFTSNPFIPKISKSILLTVYIHFLWRKFWQVYRDSNPPDLIGSLPIWCLASRSPDFYQILPIYHKILKTRGKLLIFRIFGDLSLWNTHIILTFFAKSIMVCYNSGRNDVKIQEMALERT